MMMERLAMVFAPSLMGTVAATKWPLASCGCTDLRELTHPRDGI